MYGYQYFSGDLNYNGRYALRNPLNGHVDFDKIYSSNSGQATTFYNGRTYSNVVDATTGLYIVNDQDERVNGVKRNGIIRRASMNSHNWVGGLINLKKQATENFAYQIGADLRYYKGIHYRRVDNLLGADGYRDFDKYDRKSNGAVITEAIPHNDWGNLWNVFGSTDDDPKIDYHNDGLVSWQGLFGQAEWVTDTYSVFVQGSVANQGFQRVDFFRYAPNDPMHKSEKKNILGGTIKAGANYNIDAKNNVYVNAGYYSKAPNFDAVFQDYDNYVTPDSDLTNEKVVGIEAGYGFRSSDLTMNLNVYRTSWKDRFLSDYVRINGVGGMANYTGVEQVHQGVEFDAKWKISPLVDLEGMLTLGNYEYGSDVTDSNVTNNSGQSIGSATLYLDGEKVGTTAHKTARLNLTVNPSDKFKFNLSLFHADDIFGTVNTEDFQDPEDTTMKLPSYELFDFGSSYTLSIGGKDVYLRLNINNIFDEEYYYMSNNNVFASPGEPTYKGIPLNAKVFPGWGRTYNLGLTYRF